jgi:Na+/melibiose symporter-like transporter
LPLISKTLPGKLRRSEPIASKNSSITYGMGFMGPTAIGQVFRGYDLFFYVDVLGLALALVAIIKIVYAIGIR